MRYLKGQHDRSQIPKLNLVVMMNVMITGLMFFIIVVMLMIGMQVVDSSLPGDKTTPPKSPKNPPEQPGAI